MSEYEYVYLTSEYLNRTWEVMQFWASVSFGLVALAHLGGKYLNLLSTTIITLIYMGFTFFVMNILRVNGEVVSGFLADLSQRGEQLSFGAAAAVNTAPSGLHMVAIMASFFGLFIGSLVFLWYNWRKAALRRSG